MADIFETAIGMAEPALKVVGGFVKDAQATVQKWINDAVAEALRASGVSTNGHHGAGAGSGTAETASGAVRASQPAPTARLRPLRAPGR